MAALGQLVVSFAADTARFERDLGKAARVAEKKGKAMKASFAKVTKSLTRIGSLAGLAGGSLVAMGQKAAQSADNIAKTARAAGISAEALQELRFAAEQSGVEARQLDDGMRRLTRRIGLAADGGGPAVKMFEKLGINVRDAGGNVKGTEAVFDEAVAKIGALESAAEQAAAASALFGDDAGPKLALLLQQGTAAVEAHRAKKRQLGIITEETAMKAEEFNDRLNEFNNRIAVKFQNLILKNSGAIMNLAKAFVAVVEKVIAFVSWIDQATTKLGEFVNELRGLEPPADQVQTRLEAMRAKHQQLNEQLEIAIRYNGEYGRGTDELREKIRRAEDRIANYERMLKGSTEETEGLTEITVTFAKQVELAGKNTEKTAEALTEIEVTAPKAAEGIEKMGDELEVVMDKGIPAPEDITKPWEVAGDQIKSVMEGVFSQIGGAAGKLFGLFKNGFSNLTPGGVIGVVSSVVDFIGDLFGGNKPPRVEIVNTLSRTSGGVNAQSPFTDQFGNNIRIAAQRIHDQDFGDVQQLVNGLAAFDNLIYPLLNDAQRRGVGQALVPGGNTETRQRFLDGEISLDAMLMSRFDQILGGIGGRTEGLVRATGFGDTDTGFAALQAAVGIENILSSFSTFRDDVLDGPNSLEDAMTRQGATVRDLAMSYDGSLESLQALGGGLQTFQATAAQVLRGLQAARDAVSTGIGQTIDQLILARETTPEGRFKLLKGRFDSLSAGLSGQTSAAGVLDTVNQLRALVPQILAEADATGLTGAARQQFIDDQIATLQEVETLAQERLNAIEDEKLSEIEAIGAAVGDRLDTVADKEAATASTNASTAVTMREAAGLFFQAATAGIQVDLGPATPAPNPNG